MKSKPTPPRPAADLAADRRFRNLLPGDPAPWFRQRSATNPNFIFDTVGGRYVLLAFIGSTFEPAGEAAARALDGMRDLFSAGRIAAFAVSADPRDETEKRLNPRPPAMNVFWDFNLQVSRLFGAASEDDKPGEAPVYRALWFILDPSLRVLAALQPPLDEESAAAMRKVIEGLPSPELHGGGPAHAPVLMIPRVFEPELCQGLIDFYRRKGGEESGFMRDVDGKTTLILDPAHKRRRDAQLEDEPLMKVCRERVRRRIVPEIRKAFQFEVTRIERDIVACYTADDSGHFRAHRDNTTKGTAHRRFAVTINLNSDYDGGTLSFPEYGPGQYKPPPGGAVVFSCSLLHQVSPMTRGERFAYLPFLYDDAAAKVREANNAFLDEKVGGYQGAKPKAQAGTPSPLEEDKPII